MTEAQLVPVEPTALALGEQAIAAQAAQAKALVNAQFELALLRPRHMMNVRTKLLEACERPRFAQTAMWEIPFNQKNEQTGKWEKVYVRDLSIRFAEEAVRVMGNLLVQAKIIHDDDTKRTVTVMAIDCETNGAWAIDVTCEKVVERRRLKDGQVPIRQRQNSYGDTVYLVPAETKEFTKIVNSDISKAARTAVLKLVPADIKEECRERIREVVQKEDAENPEQAMNKIVDGFAKRGVMASDLEIYLGHNLKGTTPEELIELRFVWQALRDGEVTWDQMLDGRDVKDGEELDPKTVKARKAVTDRIAKSKKSRDDAKKKEAKKAATPAQVQQDEAAGAGTGPEADRQREPGEDG